MACKNCPHLVRHGKLAADGKNIEFDNRCGLRMKQEKKVDCTHYPFQKLFDYMTCGVYLDVFKGTGSVNDVVPTSDMSSKIGDPAITEMSMI